ncbi:MAG: hypothetical protein HY000_19110 [Planctomycetes bacterium]|nr:hypothetical protein [Planctomycetota bacterium]
MSTGILSATTFGTFPSAVTVPQTVSGGGLPSPERIREEISHVLNKTLSSALEHWAAAYAQHGKRNMYLWKWCRQGVEVTTLPCVLPELREELCDTKVLGVMLDVLLDDIADQKGDDDLLEQLLDLPSSRAEIDLSRQPAERRQYAEFTIAVWNEIQSRARRFPCFDGYSRLLNFDYVQLFNVMRYSHLLNEDLSLLNIVEHDLYTPHNMHMMISGTLDLMCSPRFNRAELGALREALWHGQCMGRIGNLVTTWERELGEKDYTSGVYARAVMTGDLSLDDLHRGDHGQIRAGIGHGRHEDHFLAKWQWHREQLLARVPAVKSVDLRQLVAGLERLICLHLGSRGYK